MLDGGEGRGAGPSVVAGDEHHVGVRLRHSGRDGAHAQLGDELHADARVLVRVLQVVNQLRQVLDRVDVVMWGRRDQADAGRRVAHGRDPGIDFSARQLPALARLGALGDLDLQLARVDQVVAGDAEAAAGHLLDPGVLRVSGSHLVVAGRVFAALAGVGLAADAVHRDGQRLVRFLGDRPVAHRAGLEAAHDRLDGLHLLDPHRVRGVAEVHQAAQRTELLGVVVDHRAVFLERLVAVGAAGVLQLVDGLRIGDVELAAGAVLVLASRRKAGGDDGALGRKTALVPHAGFIGHHVDADAAHARGRPGEVLVDEVLGEPHRLEDLGAVVALDGADPHLGDHLHQALDHRLQVLLLRLGGGAGDQSLAHQVVHRLEGEIGVHRARAVPDEEREVVDLARLAALHDQAALGALALADQVMLHRGDGQQRGDGGIVRIVTPVGEDDDVESLRQALGDLPAQVLEGAAQGGAVALGVVQAGKLDRAQPAARRAAIQ